MTTSRPTAAIGLEELAEAVNRAGHDLNNLCASILGFAALTRESLDPSSPLHEYLDDPAKLTKVLGRKNARMEAAFASGEAAAIIDRNLQLMDLRAATEHYPNLGPYCTTGKWDEPLFRAWVKEQRISAMEVESAVRCLGRVAG